MSYLSASVGYYGRGINSKKPTRRTPFRWIIDQIRGDDVDLGYTVREMRAIRDTNEDVFEAQKKKLPAFTMSGYGSGRHADTLEVPSGLLQCDLDDLEPSEIVELRQALKGDPYVAAGFLSPSGRGLKLAVTIDPNRHAESFAAMMTYIEGQYLVTPDPSVKDRMRLCFLSHDPDAWVTDFTEPLPLPKREQKQDGGRTGADISLNDSASSESILNPLHASASHLNPSASQEDDGLSKGERAALADLAFDREHPLLAPLFARFVERRYTAAPGKRNLMLTHAVPFLFHALDASNVLLFVGHFYDTNAGIFKDPRTQHMHEAESILATVADNYASELSPREQRMYQLLQPPHQAAFRICRHLAFKTDTPAPPAFFLSMNDLGARINCQPQVASRILQRLQAYEIITVTVPGAKGAPGQRRIATTYSWNLQ